MNKYDILEGKLTAMELIPNTAYVYFEFSGTSNVGGNELKVIRNVHVPLK